MKITNTKTTTEVKRGFQEKYPKLKLEFYSSKHKKLEGSKEEARIKEEQLLSDLNPAIEEGSIEFKDDLKVSDLEDRFEKDFRLQIQVFRKSGDQ